MCLKNHQCRENASCTENTILLPENMISQNKINMLTKTRIPKNSYRNRHVCLQSKFNALRCFEQVFFLNCFY